MGTRTGAVDALLERVSAGDRAAFDELYRTTQARLVALSWYVLRDPHLAEEVVQEVMLEAWQGARGFDRGRGRGISWLTTMTRRRSIDRVRATQASRDRDHRDAMREDAAVTDSVEHQGETLFESDRVRRAMSRLPIVQRRAIELSYLEGYGLAEVAAMTGVGMSTAKTRVRDGLIRLRVILAA